MKRLGVLLLAVTVSAAIGLFALHAARAQTLIQNRGGGVEARVAVLEQKVAMLESQNAELRSMIQISTATGSMTINPNRKLVLKSMTVLLESTDFTDISTKSMTIRATNVMNLKASGDIILRASKIGLN